MAPRMIIRTAQAAEIPIDLLTLADPDIHHISGYLHQATIFAGAIDDQIIGVAVVASLDNDMEIMNLAVTPNQQGTGHGRALLEHVIRHATEKRARQLFIGTGNSSFPQMALYQKLGFRFSRVIRDFFALYDPPIYENGIRCLDMVVMTRCIHFTSSDMTEEKPTKRNQE